MSFLGIFVLAIRILIDTIGICIFRNTFHYREFYSYLKEYLFHRSVFGTKKAKCRKKTYEAMLYNEYNIYYNKIPNISCL